MDEAPERIWIWSDYGDWSGGEWTDHRAKTAREYVRADLSAARIAELEAQVAAADGAIDMLAFLVNHATIPDQYYERSLELLDAYHKAKETADESRNNPEQMEG